MTTPTPKPSASLTDSQKAAAAYLAAVNSPKAQAAARRIVEQGQTNSKPTIKPTTVPTPTPTPTPTTTSGAGNYGSVDPGGAYTSGVTDTVPMNVGGKVQQVPISEALKLGQGGNAGFKTIVNALRASGQIGKSVNNVTTISQAWDKTVLAAMRNNQDPFAYLNSLPPPTGTSTGDGTTTYIRDYSGSSGQSAFQAAFAQVFGRNPTAGDVNSPLKDSKGNPISWIDALNNEAQKPGNFQTVTRTNNGKTVVTKDGFDAQAWLQGQLTDYYRKGLQTGTLQPEQSIATNYQQLAGDYGVNIYDPTNKGFTTAAKLDLANLESKTTTLDQVKQGFANATLAKYGNLSPQLIQGGLTLKQIAAPALTSMGSILGLNPNNITLDDPLVQKYLAGDGKSSVMPQYQYEQLLRQDPRWNSSKDAQDSLSSMALMLGKTFGIIG